MQAIVIAHASYGHNSFFANNYLFREWTDASSIIDYLVYARNYINDCEVRYGFEAVESILDAAHALKYYGVDRYKRPPKLTKTEAEARKKQVEEEKQRQVNPLWDNLVPHTTFEHEEENPMEPEENILYFIEKNAPDLEVWEREIIRIVRKIATYYYPNYQTQCLNEGHACFTHHHIMTRLHEKGLITDGSYLEFLHSHTGVVHQYPKTMRFNPYWLGYNMFAEIKRICQEPTAEDSAWFPDLAGTNWLSAWHNAFKNFRDESFISQYLSPAMMRKERMFLLDDDAAYPREYEVDRIHDDRGFRQIREALSDSKRIGTMFPDIQVVDVDWKGKRTLYLRHTAYNNIALNTRKKERTIAQFERLWGYPVVIESIGLEEVVK
jgi:stage V sporulation protein R